MPSRGDFDVDLLSAFASAAGERTAKTKGESSNHFALVIPNLAALWAPITGAHTFAMALQVFPHCIFRPGKRLDHHPLGCRRRRSLSTMVIWHRAELDTVVGFPR